MASYKINYHLTNCTTTDVSSVNYDNEGNTVNFCGKAVDGCYFLPMMVKITIFPNEIGFFNCYEI